MASVMSNEIKVNDQSQVRKLTSRSSLPVSIVIEIGELENDDDKCHDTFDDAELKSSLLTEPNQRLTRCQIHFNQQKMIERSG